MRADALPASGTASRARGTIVGVVAVAATYVSFLLHAQFGFLALVDARLGESGAIERVMMAMGLSGLAMSLVTGALLRVVPARRLVIAGFIGCAAVALASLACAGAVELTIVAALVGAFTALLTVSLATDLRSLMPGPGLGLKVGLGTGIAYFIANLPPLFHGGAVPQSFVAAGGCLVAALALGLAPASAEAPGEGSAPGYAGRWAALGFASLVASFLALVWLDSAAFRIVQETASLQASTWAPGARTFGQGAAHLIAAVAAGHLIDRGRLRSLLLATFLLFSISFAWLMMPQGSPWFAGPLYAFGISTYSTALVLAPSIGLGVSSALSLRWRAAILYAVAGWLGSALGVGMAQDLHRIPAAFTIFAGVVLASGLALARRERARSLAVLFGPSVALALPGIALVLAPGSLRSATPADGGGASAVQRGRAVYIAEGCIHCHSQYVRPGADEAAWGPRRIDQLGEQPPLLGTRRLGPDLLCVGARRSAEWERLHLIDPRSLAPGSRMPSYAHLFGRPGSRVTSRGDDLVAYLQSLGAGLVDERAAAVRAAIVSGDASGASAARGAELFAASCAPCHGAAGRGDGPLASAVGSPFLDLALEGLPRVDRVTGDEFRDLERVIRFGIAGSAMAGHELLSEDDLASLARHVQALRAGTAAPASASARP